MSTSFGMSGSWRAPRRRTSTNERPPWSPRTTPSACAACSWSATGGAVESFAHHHLSGLFTSPSPCTRCAGPDATAARTSASPSPPIRRRVPTSARPARAVSAHGGNGRRDERGVDMHCQHDLDLRCALVAMDGGGCLRSLVPHAGLDRQRDGRSVGPQALRRSRPPFSKDLR